MENQENVRDQNIAQIDKNSTRQSTITPEKSKINYWMYSTIVLFFLLIGFIMFYLRDIKGRSSLSTTQDLVPTATTRPIHYNYKLPFNEYTVVLDRVGSGKIEGSFWELPIKNVDFEVNPIEPFDTLSLGSMYYVVRQNIFYDLQPGGFSTLSLISDNDLKSRVRNEKTSFKEVACKINDYPLGTIKAKAIKCIITNTNPEDLNQIDESFINNCYLPTDKGKYLAYEQKLKPMGNVDLCENLTKIGVQGVMVEPVDADQAIRILQEIPEVQQVQQSVISAGRKPFFTIERWTEDIITISLRESFPDDPHTTRIDTFNVNVMSKVITVEDVVAGGNITLEEWKKTIKERFQ